MKYIFSALVFVFATHALANDASSERVRPRTVGPASASAQTRSMERRSAANLLAYYDCVRINVDGARPGGSNKRYALAVFSPSCPGGGTCIQKVSCTRKLGVQQGPAQLVANVGCSLKTNECPDLESCMRDDAVAYAYLQVPPDSTGGTQSRVKRQGGTR